MNMFIGSGRVSNMRLASKLSGRTMFFLFVVAGEKATRTEIIVNPESLRDLDS